MGIRAIMGFENYFRVSCFCKCMARVLVCFLLVSVVAGCTLKQTGVQLDTALSPIDGQPASYLLLVMGEEGDMPYNLLQTSILVLDEDKSQGLAVSFYDNFAKTTGVDIRDAKGPATAYVVALRPGTYYLRGLTSAFSESGFIRSYPSFSASDIPIQLEPGKAVYLGHYRARCPAEEGSPACRFVRYDRLEQDIALFKAKQPNLPAIEKLELRGLDRAVPFTQLPN